MAIAIILRNKLPVNKFRDLLIGSIKTKAGNKALLCSGFFQENFKGSPYQASQELNFANEVASSGIELNTVGIHNWAWKQSYKDFQNNMLSAGGNVNCYYKTGLKWHAKVFILFKDDSPIFGIIGSSNITRNAFGSLTNFNYECDVMIWPDTNVVINNWMNEQTESIESPYDIIKAPYIAEMNNGITVQERLNNLAEEIFSSGIKILE